MARLIAAGASTPQSTTNGNDKRQQASCRVTSWALPHSILVEEREAGQRGGGWERKGEQEERTGGTRPQREHNHTGTSLGHVPSACPQSRPCCLKAAFPTKKKQHGEEETHLPARKDERRGGVRGTIIVPLARVIGRPGPATHNQKQR